MKNIIQFIVSKGLDGFYVASAAGLPIVTQGRTLDELTQNIKEATELYFETPRQGDEFERPKTPSLLINYEVSLNSHA